MGVRMQNIRWDFTPRQHMTSEDYEYFHYKDEFVREVEYHNHDFFEIYFLRTGKVTYIIEGKSYKLRPGDIILINNKELHKPVVEEGETYERIVIWVDPDFVEKQGTYGTNLSMCFESSAKNHYNLLRPGIEVQKSIENIIKKFEVISSNVSYGSNILKEIYLTELIIYLNRAYLNTFEEEIETDIEYNEKISSIVRYINDNLHKDLSLDSLSSIFYLSKYHLLREFKKYVGYSIHQYIHKKRLIMAKGLLKQGLPVTEVFMKCGFGDYSNFIRAFKKAFGLSPKKYYKSTL